MIFRKDNRGESFQRQISSLRQQLQTEAGVETDEYQYDETDETSQFAITPSTPSPPPPTSAREDAYKPARPSAEREPAAPSTQATPAPAPAPPPAPIPTPSPERVNQSGSYRSSWQTADTNTSIIAVNAHWNGTLRSEGSLHVYGRADGEMHASQDLYVAEGAEVDAQLFADNVVVAGVVRGQIDAHSRIELLPQAQVFGDIKAPKLVVHEGARLSGNLKMETGGDTASSSPYSTTGKSSKSRRSSR